MITQSQRTSLIISPHCTVTLSCSSKTHVELNITHKKSILRCEYFSLDQSQARRPIPVSEPLLVMCTNVTQRRMCHSQTNVRFIYITTFVAIFCSCDTHDSPKTCRWALCVVTELEWSQVEVQQYDHEEETHGPSRGCNQGLPSSRLYTSP